MLLPSPLPFETLHSRICRYLNLTNTSPRRFFIQILGNRHQSVHPFLNVKLGLISKIDTYTDKELWRYQTLAPLFAYYLPKYRSTISNLELKGDQLHRACQLSTFKATEALSLRFCSKCSEEDMREYGVAYWHLEHQITGVDACHKHNLWLNQHQFTTKNSKLTRDLLPNEDCFAFDECPELAMEFAQFAFNQLKKIQTKKLNDVNHLTLLNQKGFVTQRNIVKRKEIFPMINNQLINVFRPYSRLLPSENEDYLYWQKVVNPEESQPPFKHMLLEFFLSKLPDKIRSEPIHYLTERPKRKLPDAGIARRTDYESTSSTKKELHNKIIEMAWKGFHRQAIANQFNIKIGKVESLISSVEGLVLWRKRCRYESKRRRHKYQLIRYLSANPNAIRQEIKRDCNAAFFWFYANEKQWFEDFLPKVSPHRKLYKVNWEQRDKDLIPQIKSILKNHPLPLTRYQIDCLLGKHNWLIAKKHKLPRTMALLKRFGIY